MFRFWRRYSPREKMWGIMGGVIIVGSVGKVAYFKYCRSVLVDKANQTHLDAAESHREAREFADKAAREREEQRASRPPLTDEQREQLRAYLQLMNEHHLFKPDPKSKS